MMPMLSEKILPPVSWIWCWIQIKGLALFRQTQTLNICTKMTAMFFRHLINAWLHFMKIIIRHNNKFPLTNEILKSIFFFQPQTNLKFISSNPNNFYILTSNTITDKCTSVRGLCKLFQQSFLPTRSPLPTLSELIYIHIT